MTRVFALDRSGDVAGLNAGRRSGAAFSARVARMTGKKKPVWRSLQTGAYMAERTGLEPATSGVTGQHSNQLNYRSALYLATHPAPVLQANHPGSHSPFTVMASPRGFEPLLLP